MAGAKAVVNEAFHYDVPGNFCKGQNYFEFSLIRNNIEIVDVSIDNSYICYRR